MFKFSDCSTDVRRDLLAACQGDEQNAAELYEQIFSVGYEEVVLAERERCLSLYQLARAKGGSDALVSDSTIADVNAGTEGVPLATLKTMSDRQLSFGSSSLLLPRGRSHSSAGIEPN